MPISIAEDPLTCVARGAGVVVEDLESLKDVLVPIEFGKILR
jgi:actin-like ATPase involved in cell morphogenesis